MFKRVLIWGGIGLVALFILLVVIVSLVGEGEGDGESAPTSISSDIEEPTQIPTVNPTTTPAPTTRSEVPTATPAPTPTPTPRPTLTPTPIKPTPTQARPTPTPTQTGQPCPTEEETLYFDQISVIAVDLAQAILDIDAQSTLASADPMLLLDLEWLGRVASITFDLNYEARRIRNVDPVPESVRAIHDEWLDVADITDEFADLFMDGIDNLDQQKVTSAGTLMYNISVRAELLSLEVERFCG